MIRNKATQPEQARGQQTPAPCEQRAKKENLDVCGFLLAKDKGEGKGTQEVMKRGKNKGSGKKG